MAKKQETASSAPVTGGNQTQVAAAPKKKTELELFAEKTKGTHKSDGENNCVVFTTKTGKDLMVYKFPKKRKMTVYSTEAFNGCNTKKVKSENPVLDKDGTAKLDKDGKPVMKSVTLDEAVFEDGWTSGELTPSEVETLVAAICK